MIEERVNKLAELQEERRENEDATNSNPAVASYDEEIARIESRLADMVQKRNDVLLPYGERQAALDEKIDEIKAQIIDEWTGEKKTMVFGVRTLKFRTTQSLVVENVTLVLTGLLDHTSVKDVAKNYITGFKKTAVKKYMGVLDLPMGAAYINQKTTVKLEETQ